MFGFIARVNDARASQAKSNAAKYAALLQKAVTSGDLSDDDGQAAVSLADTLGRHINQDLEAVGQIKNFQAIAKDHDARLATLTGAVQARDDTQQQRLTAMATMDAKCAAAVSAASQAQEAFDESDNARANITRLHEQIGLPMNADASAATPTAAQPAQSLPPASTNQAGAAAAPAAATPGAAATNATAPLTPAKAP